MNKEKYLQFIASFLIALVMTIPFYVTSAYAGIDKVTVKGSDGIERVARPNDALDFTVEATSPTTQITKDHMYLGADIKFDKCTSGINKAAICTLKYPSTGKQDFGNNPFQFVISVFKDTSKSQLEDSKTGVVAIDNLPPVLQLSKPKETFSGAENVLLDYEVVDMSCDGDSCAGKCSGIKNIEFMSSGGSFKQTVDPKTTGCSVKDRLTLDPKKLGEGTNVIIAKATDKFGQASQEASIEFSLDLSAPRILTETFVISRRGIAINTYSPSSVPVEVFIDISANDLDANSVTAEFTALNPSAKLVRATCQRISNELHRCRWSINLNPGTGSGAAGTATTPSTTSSSSQSTTSSTTPSTTSSSTSSTTSSTTQSATSSTTGAVTTTSTTTASRAIIISASDTLGNKATTTISKPLALDNKGPAVQSIKLGTSKDKLFAKPTGSLVEIAFDEATGMIAGETFLHAGSSRFAASSCRKDSTWVCRWLNINFPSGSVMLQIKSDTEDIFGNDAQESQPVEVIVDAISPVVTGISLTPVGTLSASAKDLFKIEDKIAVEANITEEHDITSTADFSKFTDNTAKVPGTCKRLEGSRQQCTWLSDPITKGGANNIKFNFTDPALNEVIVEKPLTVLELDTGQKPDFWGNSVECSPRSIDRQLGTLINQRTYCRINLEPKADNVETLSISPISLSSCKSTQPIVQSIESFNRERGSTEPFLKITFKKDALEINEVKLTCTFNIISRSGNRVAKNPETETAEFDIKFYNFPLGKFDEGVQKRIDDAKKDARESKKIVGELNKIIEISRKVCRVFGIIYNAVVIYTTITAIQKVADDTCRAVAGVFSEACKNTLGRAGQASCYGEAGAESLADKSWITTGGPFCKFVNCQWAPGIIGDYQQWISNQINKLPGGERLPGPGLGSDTEQPQKGVTEEDGKEAESEDVQGQEDSKNKEKNKEKKTESGNTRTRLAAYMDPENNLYTGIIFACIPGIISGLDKQRQIKCLYADCLENSVAKDGLSPTVCEDLKNFAECKYTKGEIFALIPYAEVFDHYAGILKEALSNPWSAIGIGVGLTIGPACKHACPPKAGSSVLYITCQVIKITSKAGEVIENTRGLYKEGFKIRQDYCSRLNLEENEEEESEESAPASGSVPSSGNR